MNDKQSISPEAKRAGRKWGAAIVGGLAVVVAVNVFVAWLVRDQGFPLVRDDYYEAGLAYDASVAAGRQNVARQLRLQIDRDGALTFWQGEQTLLPDNGKLFYYRPNNPSLDYETTINVNAVSGRTLPTIAPSKAGRWQVTFVGFLAGQETRLSATYFQQATNAQ